MTRHIQVVGAVIIRDGLVLCAQRGVTGALPGLWEFPGGKVEAGESPASALTREITEELGCTVIVGEEVTTTKHEYDFGIVSLTTHYCELIAGGPQASEHAALAWRRPEELDSLEWAPADIPAVAMVQAKLSG